LITICSGNADAVSALSAIILAIEIRAAYSLAAFYTHHGISEVQCVSLYPIKFGSVLYAGKS
jgi:hypothetical protein